MIKNQSKVTPKFLKTLEEVCIIEIENSTKEDPATAEWIKAQYFFESHERINVRRVREAIHSLRQCGMPICANGEGYYWPSTEEELKDYVDRFSKLVKSQCVALAALKKAYPRIRSNVIATIEAE